MPRKKPAKKKKPATAIVEIDGAIIWEGQVTIYKTRELGRLVAVLDSKEIGNLFVEKEEE